LIQREKNPVLLDIAVGSGSTVTVRVAKHPVDATVYVMLAVPVVSPQTTPLEEPTEAHVVDEGSLHVPPGVASVSVNPQVPTHTCGLAGLMAAGAGCTVIVLYTEHIPPLV